MNPPQNQSDGTIDPMGAFKPVHASLPQQGRTIGERAQDMANALGWMRNIGLAPGDCREMLGNHVGGGVVFQELVNQGPRGNEFDSEAVP